MWPIRRICSNRPAAPSGGSSNEFQPGTNFLAWARETARLEVLHFLRSQSRSRVQFDEDLIAALAETQSQLEPETSPHEEYLQVMAHCLGALGE